MNWGLSILHKLSQKNKEIESKETHMQARDECMSLGVSRHAHFIMPSKLASLTLVASVFSTLYLSSLLFNQNTF